MFDTIADMLRGSAPDDLAHALGTDRTQTRRAMEIGLPALITGLRDKTLEPGGAQNLATMLDEPSAAVPDDLGPYLSAGDPARGAAMLDVAFGDRGEPALAALSSASGLSTRLLAQVMSVLAPLATGTVANAADRSPDGLRSYLGAAVNDLQDKGFGRVVDLVSPAGVEDGGLHVPITPEVEDVQVGDDAPDIIAGDDEIMIGGPESDDGDVGGTLVEGAFPGVEEFGRVEELPGADMDAAADADMDAAAAADIDLDVGGSVDLDHPTEALDLGDDMPSFGTEVAGLSAASDLSSGPLGGDIELPASAVVLAETGTLDADPEFDTGLDTGLGPDIDDTGLEGRGLSNLGWLWWLLGAVIGLGILIFAISRCGGSDSGDEVDSGAEASATQEPLPTVVDPAVAQRQATLDSILLDYPGVTGEVFGEVAVLNGTVVDETERAVLDGVVRDAGLGVQNNVTVAQAAAAQGYSLNDLIDVQSELSTLRSLLDQAGLGDALDSGADFTLFAPTNAAFDAIADQLAGLQDDPQALQDVLRYHLLVGAQDAATLSAITSVPTQLDGQNIEIDAAGGAIVLNGSVQVIATDAIARNGVMHITNGVLLPQSAAAELPEEIGAELGLAPITFALNSSDIADAGKVELDKVVAFLLATPGSIEIGGHTDSDGDAAYNQTLSQDRAEAVKTYLAANGIPADSMTAVGFGATQPIAPNDTSENKARNRRIEFRPS